MCLPQMCVCSGACSARCGLRQGCVPASWLSLKLSGLAYLSCQLHSLWQPDDMGLCDGRDPPDVHSSGLPAGGLTLGGRERERETGGSPWWAYKRQSHVPSSFRWTAVAFCLSFCVWALMPWRWVLFVCSSKWRTSTFKEFFSRCYDFCSSSLHIIG